MVTYFNNSPTSIDTTFFGTPLLLTKAFNFFDDDEVKEQIDNHERKQLSLGSSLRSIDVTGVQLSNWSNSQRTSTLHRDLMAFECIISKTVIKGKNHLNSKAGFFTQSSLTIKHGVFISLKQTFKKSEVLHEAFNF